MKILKIVGFVILGLIILIVAVGLIAPKKYEVERSVLIDAPRDIIYMHVQYWSSWQAWSPWAEMDSSMVVTIEGEDGLKDAKYIWKGDPKLTGEGEMINTGMVQNESFDFHLHFIKPWESHSDGYFRLSEEDGKTRVAWGMYGGMPFPWNIMMLFQSMDSMMDKDFTRGLAKLKTVVDEEMAAIKAFEIKKVLLPTQTYVILRKHVPFSQLSDFFGESFGTLMGQLAEAGKKPSGMPGALYYGWDFATSSTDVAAAVPIKGRAPKGMESVRISRQSAYQGDYFGPYEESGVAHWAFERYFKEQSLEHNPPAIELYMNDPTTVADPSELHTRMIYLAK